MAQHDYNISNQSFPAVRADINNALVALATKNSGPLPPSETYAFQGWYDTTDNLVKERNSTNTAWIVIGQIDQPGYGLTSQAALDLLIPAGIVVQVSGNIPPAGGWVKANGDIYNRAAQPRLWAWAQASGNLAASEGAKTKGQYGPGNGTTTFSIPDLRGWFVRGWDNGAGVDPGRGIGTEQASQVEAHTHPNAPLVSSPGTGTTPGLAAGYYQSNQITGASSGTETRPRNIALLFCIKT
jgi:microcystin-dependent protein